MKHFKSVARAFRRGHLVANVPQSDTTPVSLLLRKTNSGKLIPYTQFGMGYKSDAIRVSMALRVASKPIVRS